MIISNCKLKDIDKSLAEVNKRFGGNVRLRNYEVLNLMRTRHRLTLRVNNSRLPGAKLGPSGRHTVSACWHVHGYFFDNLPPDTIIKALGRTIRPGDPWEDMEIGSIMYPRYFSEACNC